MRNNSDHERKPHTRTLFLLVTYGILLYMGLQNLSSLKSVFVWIFAILEPVAYGICIAFVINLFLKLFQQKIFHSMAHSDHAWERKLNPILSAVCTGLVAMILLALIIFLIIPQFTTAVNTLIEKMPSSQDQLLSMIESTLNEWNAPAFIMEKIREFNVDWDTATAFLGNLLDGKYESVLGTAFSATRSVLSTATNLVLGLIIAIYLLCAKSRVLYITHKVIELIAPQKYQERIFRVLRLTNTSFGNFLTGQFIEAIIIGSLCTVGLYIFRFPYAATIGILTGITALLPIIGAWIGGGIGALLIWVEAPDRVIWFLVFILALQQLEGQFIYPRVVGNSIGLPGLLVLIAVILGGGFGGIFGIIFTVPVFAIIYQLLKEAIDNMPNKNGPDPEPASIPDAPFPIPEPQPAAVPAPEPPAPVQKQQPKVNQNHSRKRKKRK